MKPKIYSLHGLRALAATMVAVTHLALRLAKYDLLTSEWQRLAMIGSAGVYTFFIISGFIMIRTSIDSFGKSNAAKVFFTKRLIRVVPLYYIYSLLFILKLMVTHEHFSVSQILLSFGFIPYVNEIGMMQPIYSLGWTLNYEIYFYSVFAICLSFKRLLGVGTLVLFIVAVVGIAHLSTEVINGDPDNLLGFFGAPVVVFFLVGVGIGLLPVPAILPTVICFPIAAAVLLCGVAWLGALGQALACVVAVFLTTWERPSARPSSTKRTIELLGESSYSLYLTHSFVLGPLVAIGIRLGIASGSFGWAYDVSAILVCIVTSVLLYLVLEKPLLKYLRLTLLKSPASVSVGA